MYLKKLPGIIARLIERRSLLIIILVVILSAILGPGITQLKPETGLDTMLSPDSEIFRDTTIYEKEFGAESNVILLRGSLEDIFSKESLSLLEQFEQYIHQEQGDKIHSLVGPVTILKMAAEEAEKQGYPVQWNDPDFVDRVLYGQEGSIRTDMQPLITSDGRHVLINVFPVEGLEHDEALELVRYTEDFFKEAEKEGELEEIAVSVIGDVEMMEVISDSITSNLRVLLLLSVGVMAVILMLMFRVRWNLLSLLMVGTAALWTFGAMGYAGIPLSMSSMAVLPILIGIGIDYSIQFHNRYQEEAYQSKSVSRAIISSITIMFPVVGIALIATIIGFITLFISEVPLIQDFGKNLAIGVVLSFIVALFLLHSIVNLADRRIPVTKMGKASAAAIQLFEKGLAIAARFSLRHPAPILVIAVIAGVAGGVADNWLPSKVNHEELMPQDSSTLKDIQYLRDVTGYSGELHFLVEGGNVTSPEVLEWMKDYQDKMKSSYPEIRRIDSPAKIVSDATVSGSIPEDQDEINRILGETPSIYVERAISGNRQIASLSFGIEHLPIEDIHGILEQMIGETEIPQDLDIRIAPAGNLATVTEAVDAMMGRRTLMNSICLGAVFVILLLLYRRLTRAVFTIIPVGMVIGWSSLTLFASGVPLNPMTAVLGVLVIGICTEFIVLLLGRYEEEKRGRGSLPREAMVTAISKTGRAIVTTALTTLGGFGVLIASNFVLIRDFGIATTISVFLCLIAAMVVMPPVVVWWDTRVVERLPGELGKKV
ncbi:MAG: hydrophobe/amphiphile efflux-3 (HAE3) family transporter [Dehalococcoidia bacterium]